MSVLNSLFNPSAVVEKKDYWIGGVILLILGALIYAAPLLFMSEDAGFSGVVKGSFFSMFIYLLIYPWFCLIGGRLRDTGNSPAIFIAAFLGYAVLSSVFSMILIMPEMTSNMEEMLKNMPEPEDLENGEESFEQMFAVQSDLMRRMIPKQVIGSTIASVLIMLPFGLMKQKFDGNPYKTNKDVFN